MEDLFSWTLKNYESFTEAQQKKVVRAVLLYNLAPFAGAYFAGTQAVKKLSIPAKYFLAARIAVPLASGFIGQLLCKGELQREFREIYEQRH